MKLLKRILGILLITVTISWHTINTNCTNSVYILNQVKKKYDSNNQWDRSALKMHIQEPRVGNPQRHTKLILINSNDYFEMDRFREDGVVKRILTSTGESKIFFNGESELSEAITSKYRLTAETSKLLKRFYEIMYGLPMSISDRMWKQIAPAQKSEFEGKEVYRVRLELENKMISKYWTLIIGVKNYELLAIEFNHPEEPEKEDEIIKFEGEFEMNGIKIPRIRNWYLKDTNKYLGTDIIVEELK